MWSQTGCPDAERTQTNAAGRADQREIMMCGI